MHEKVILTKKYIKEAVDQLKRQFNLVMVEDSGKSLSEILTEHKDTEALISFLSDTIDRDIIDRGENLKIIANYAVGYNNIAIDYAIKKGLYVTHTPDVLTNATADLTMALILAVSRRIVESDSFLRRGEFKGWDANLLLGKELNGSVLGILGMGRIGQAAARRAVGFGLKVIYYSEPRAPEIEREYGYEFVSFAELVGKADIVSVHIPYTPAVHHLFNKDVFDRMKPDAIFINTARGPLMNEAHLTEKLEQNESFGAGLDVYEFEPQVNERLTKRKNAVLVPHIGSATYKARLGMALMTVNSVRQALSGRIPDNLIPEWPGQSKQPE
jgi:glyoxylate reductase